VTSAKEHVTEAIVSRAQAGDCEAIAEVCKGTLGLVRWWAKRYGRDEQSRDELVSIGHLAIFDALRGYRPGKSKWGVYVSLWLRARMANSKRQAFRRYEVDGAGIALMADEHPSPLEQLAQDDDVHALRAAVARLPEKQRHIINGRLEGHTLREVSDEVGCSYEAVRQAEIRAAYRLRALLGVESAEPIALKRKSPTRHGLRSMYGKGCRCGACREANAAYQRGLYRRAA
jgi:RNA polymerase sigma factor (sigma-70 family)